MWKLKGRSHCENNGFLFMRRRFLNILIAIDQLLWVLLTLGHGAPDETFSAAAWRMEAQGKLAGKILRPIIDAIFMPIEDEHCFRSFLGEVMRSDMPDIYRVVRDA